MKGSFFCSGRVRACIGAFAAASLLTGSVFAQAEDDAEVPTGDADAAAQDAEGANGDDASSDAPDEGENEAAENKDDSASAEAAGALSASAALGADGEAKAEGSATTTGGTEAPAVAPGYGPPEEPDPNYSFGVQLLPGSAYPEPQVRGIKGGSLWFTMHGLQWPYMPMRDKPGLMLGLSGFGWVDTGWERIKRGDPNQGDIEYWIQTGRFGLRATPTYSQDNWFVQGQAELIANSDQNANQPSVADTDDLWVRIGQWNTWDVQLGRFESWELYHFGMGMDLNTLERDGATEQNPVPQIYGVTYNYYRERAGNIAVHAYPLEFLRFELLGKYGQGIGGNVFGARPAAILDFGIVKVKGGAEYRKRTDQGSLPTEEVKKGGGGAIQVVLDPYVELGVNGAYALTDVIDTMGNTARDASITTYSYGGFANANVIENLVVGAGANLTWVEDINVEPGTGRVGEFDHLQVFGAVQYAVFGRFYLKAVGAYARSRMADTFNSNQPPYENTMVSGRLRASVYF